MLRRGRASRAIAISPRMVAALVLVPILTACSGAHGPATTASGGASASPGAAIAGSVTPTAVPTPTTTAASTTACVGSESTATPAADTTAPPVLADILFVSDTRGWAVGAGRILTTRDGGAHWAEQYRGTAALQAVRFIDAEHGWALGKAHLLVTSDGGDCWRELPMPAPALQEVGFDSASDGWGIERGDSRVSFLAHSTDGGLTWERVAAPQVPASVCFSDPHHGWLMTESAALYRSHDAGRTWTKAFTPANGDAFGRARSTQCAGSTAVWALARGNCAAGTCAYWLYHGADDGGFQTVVCNASLRGCTEPDAAARFDVGEAGPFSALDASGAVLFGWSPAATKPTTSFVLVSRGGDVVGTPASVVPHLEQPAAAAFRSASSGWLVGSMFTGRSAILHTADGGVSWQTQWQSPAR